MCERFASQALGRCVSAVHDTKFKPLWASGGHEPAACDASRSAPGSQGASSVTPTADKTPESPCGTVKCNGISRVPTHAILPVQERRAYTRATLSLPMRLKRVAGQSQHQREFLRTTNISSTGALFRCPWAIEPGTTIEVEVSLVDRPQGQGSVLMVAEAKVVRIDPESRPDWHLVAVCFDEIAFRRDDALPSRFAFPSRFEK